MFLNKGPNGVSMGSLVLKPGMRASEEGERRENRESRQKGQTDRQTDRQTDKQTDKQVQKEKGEQVRQWRDPH